MKNSKEIQHGSKKDHYQLLVICDNRHNYFDVFQDCKIGNKPLKVDQAMWDEISLSVYQPSSVNRYGLVVDLCKKKNPFKKTPQEKNRTVIPDFLLIRNKPRGTEKYDYRNIFFGFMYSGIGSVNSLESLYFCLERVLVHSQLRKIEAKIGRENFPLIEQYYHGTAANIVFPPKIPCVAKVSYTHAGYGKTLVESSDRLRDLRSLVSLHSDYTTTEEFVDADYELRLQKIGNNYRAMKKQLVSYWKSNSFGVATHDDVDVEEQHVKWLDECSKMFGGLDIFAIDVLHGKDGKFYILELNGTSIGLGPDHIHEDLVNEKNITLKRMEEKLIKKKEEKEIKKDINIENVNYMNKFQEKEKDYSLLEERYKNLLEKYKKLEQDQKKSFFSSFFK